jgi:hypothetical protein
MSKSGRAKNLEQAIANARTPLAAALQGLSARSLATTASRCGLNAALLTRYATGRSQPAPWLARAIAAALGQPAEEIFPHLDHQQRNARAV